MFNEIDKYVENAAEFVYAGIMEVSVVALNVPDIIHERIDEQLLSMGLTTKQLEGVLRYCPSEFFFKDNRFNIMKPTKILAETLVPYVEKGNSVRTWGEVPITNDENILEMLRVYECNCDDFIVEQRIISVCAYHALTTPAYIQNELLKTHTHLMTDHEVGPSPFYHREHHKSLSREEFDRLQRISEQNQALLAENLQLANENAVVKAKNEVVEQNELKLRTIINELPIPIIIRSKCKLLFSNEVAKDQLFIKYNTEHLTSFFNDFDKHLIGSPSSKVKEHQFILTNGKKKYFLVKSIHMFFERKPAIMHSFVDITKEKENEQLVIRSEKMQIAGELAASVAHELRNPLTAIKGFFHVLKSSGEDKEMYYHIINDELNRIEQISGELLTLAKPHSENRRNYNLVQLIEEVKLLLTSESNMKSIEIILDAVQDEININCENTKIKQVFINLIKNAIDAMDDGGNIVITLKVIQETIEVQVIDQGCGIPEELLDKVGEPFYTTKEKGTGIGMMVCYQIIENHGGSIEVESKVNIGTTFTIRLPLLI